MWRGSGRAETPAGFLAFKSRVPPTNPCSQSLRFLRDLSPWDPGCHYDIGVLVAKCSLCSPGNWGPDNHSRLPPSPKVNVRMIDVDLVQSACLKTTTIKIPASSRFNWYTMNCPFQVDNWVVHVSIAVILSQEVMVISLASRSSDMSPLVFVRLFCFFVFCLLRKSYKRVSYILFFFF